MDVTAGRSQISPESLALSEVDRSDLSEPEPDEWSAPAPQQGLRFNVSPLHLNGANGGRRDSFASGGISARFHRR